MIGERAERAEVAEELAEREAEAVFPLHADGELREKERVEAEFEQRGFACGGAQVEAGFGGEKRGQVIEEGDGLGRRTGGFRCGCFRGVRGGGALGAVGFDPVALAGESVTGQRDAAGGGAGVQRAPVGLLAGEPAVAESGQRVVICTGFGAAERRGEDAASVAAAELLRGVREVVGDDEKTVLERAAAGLQRERDIGEREVRVSAEKLRELAGHRLQREAGFRREHDELRAGNGRGFRRDGRFLDHDVRVRAADAEGADARPARMRGGFPLGELRHDAEGRVGEVDAGIRFLEMQARGNLRVAERERGLDQAGDARGGFEVAEIGLRGAEQAGAVRLAGRTECFGQRGDLDGIAERRGGAVRLHVADGVGGHARERVGQRDDLGLSVHARRGEADLAAAVVIHGRTFDHRVNRIAVGERIGEAFQNDDTAAVAEDGAARVGIEGAAVTVGAGDRAFLIEVTAGLRESDRDAAGERGVALVAEERIDGLRDRDERSAARGLHGDARAAQIEAVAEFCGEVVLVRAGDERVAADLKLRDELRERAGLRADVVEEVGIQAGAREDADAAAEARGIEGGVLQRVPGTFEKDAVLRVGQLGVARGEAEKRGVEFVGIGQRAAGANVVRVCDGGGIEAGGEQFLVGETGDRLGAGAQVLPQLADIARAGKTAGEADDGDTFGRQRIGGH